MAETRTDLVVNARAKGFSEVQQQASKLVEKATKAAADQAKGYSKLASSSQAYKKEIKSLEKAIADLGKQQLATLRAMTGMDKVSGVYKQLKENLKNLGVESVRTNQKLALTKRLFAPETAKPERPLSAREYARGGFTQGFTQEALGINLQRGPGMWRQAAGAAAGRMVHSGLMMPFGGVEGVQNLLSSIPIIGGRVGGQFGNAMQYAQGAMGLQQARLGAAPLFGVAGSKASMARQQAMADVEMPLDVAAYRRNPKYETQAVLNSMELRSAKDKPEAGMSTALITRQRAADYERKSQEAGDIAAATASNAPFADLRKAGVELGGMTEQEAVSAMSAVLQRGGGALEEAQQQGFSRSAFAAQTAYGVGPEVSGAFLQAGRRGGAVGAQGRGGEAMVDALQGAVSLALKGSELQDYMAQMANDISAWKQTGIPVNTKSIQQMSAGIASSGLGGVRGAVIGRGLAQAGQRLAAGGVQDTVDMLMLQTMGGFKGGGMEDYEKAQIRLEQMGTKGHAWDDTTVKELVSQLMFAGGGGATGRQVVRQAFGRKGVQMAQGETMAFTKWATGEEMTPEEQAQARKIRGEMNAASAGGPQDMGGLETQALDMVKNLAPALSTAADLQNKQNDVGLQWLGTMQTLQKSMLDISQAFSYVAQTPITALANGTLTLTGALKALATDMDTVSEQIKVHF